MGGLKERNIKTDKKGSNQENCWVHNDLNREGSRTKQTGKQRVQEWKRWGPEMGRINQSIKKPYGGLLTCNPNKIYRIRIEGHYPEWLDGVAFRSSKLLNIVYSCQYETL